MRILILSHTVLSETTNMGKTLLSYFHAFEPEETAQFFIQSEVPANETICRNYYRFSDQDAVKSLFSVREQGRIFGQEDIDPNGGSTRTDSGVVGAAYRHGRKRTPAVFIMRNILWHLAKWDTPRFWEWVDAFSPDLICCAPGDYGFFYHIAAKVAEHTGKPLVMFCVDDYFLYNKNRNSLLGRIEHRFFLRTVESAMNRADAIFTICDSMKAAYEERFRRPCHILHTPAARMQLPLEKEAEQISYIGNLTGGRAAQLITIGRQLEKIQLDGKPERIDVYSAESDPQILKELTEENGICFHGAITAEEVKQVMARSMAVIHTESFDPHIMQSIRFSVSTKIAESLMYGPCLLAYGPLGIASMDYLQENRAAYMITSPDALEYGLTEFLSDAKLREEILARARVTAQDNHNVLTSAPRVRKILEAIAAVGQET